MIQWNSAQSKSEKSEIESKFGIKPTVNSRGEYIESPYFRLYDLYGFDIFQDSPVDLFHITLIGLLPTVVELMDCWVQQILHVWVK